MNRVTTLVAVLFAVLVAIFTLIIKRENECEARGGVASRIGCVKPDIFIEVGK